MNDVSYQDAINSIYSVKYDFTKPRTNEDAKVEIKLFSKQLFGGRIDFPSIIVAGTNGKGSTATASESILRSCGLKTLLLTSPHVFSPKERIKINGQPIDDDIFVELYQVVMNEIQKKNIPQPYFPNFFILMFAYLVLKFKKENDLKVVAIIEVSIGGRFDLTKLFKPTVSVITRLDYDHMEMLGSTPYLISWNKFGIITKTSVNFTIPQSELFNNALNKLVSETHRKLIVVQPNWTKDAGIHGPTAEANVSLSVASSIELMKIINYTNFDEKNIETGVKNAHIDGRYHIISTPENGIKWCIDGAHTCESIELCKNWFEIDCLEGNISNCVLLCAVSKNRDPNITLATLLNLKWKQIIYIDSFGKGDFNSPNYLLFHSTSLAYETILNIKPSHVLVTGSLYLVSEILKLLHE